MPEPGTTSEVRIRPSVGERAFVLLICSFTPLVLTIFFTEAVLDVPWELLVGFVIALVAADQVVRRNGVELTAKHAVIRSPLWSTKRLRWGEILAVTYEDIAAGRRIVLWTHSNSVTDPREMHPVYVSRKQLDATFELVNAWWMKHRGF